MLLSDSWKAMSDCHITGTAIMIFGTRSHRAICCFALTTRSNDSWIGLRYATTVRWVLRYGGGSSGWIDSIFGGGGGKCEMYDGVAGREAGGRWLCASEDKAAIDPVEEEDMVESVRLRSWPERPAVCEGAAVPGRVLTERADEMDVRRRDAWEGERRDSGEEGEDVNFPTAEEGGETDDDSFAEAVSAVTVVSGARGAGLPWPYE